MCFHRICHPCLAVRFSILRTIVQAPANLKVLENVPSAFYVECVVQVKRDNDVDHELTLRAAIQRPEPTPVPQEELDSEEHRTHHGHYVIG